MRTVVALALTLALAIALAGCGGSGADSKSGSSASSGSASGGVAAVSKYDAGPRAGEAPVDEAKAKLGEPLFTSKGCSACHSFGKRMSGPDLSGVTMRRTAQWMENQILHPEVMTHEDPISHGLFAQFALQMPNQGLTPDEARCVIEYFKQRDRANGASATK